MIVNLLTLEQSFETCEMFRPASTGPVKAGRNVARVSKLRYKVSKVYTCCTSLLYTPGRRVYQSRISGPSGSDS